jgi:carboxymethylenebutenolidase
MWNEFRTDEMGGMVARVMMIPGGGADQIRAYVAQPEGPGPFPGVVLTHHPPGWDEFHREFARRFAEHGFIAIVPNLFERYGHGTPTEVAAQVRSQGGLADDSAVADAEAALTWVQGQPTSNGKVGVIGPCGGGRIALLAASHVPAFGAVADLWGGNVVMAPERLTEKQPVAPIDLTPNLTVPLIGLFGNEDQAPSPAEVDQHEAALQQYGKTYMFHRYDGAGHGFFFYDQPRYRPQQAMDGWNKIVAFFSQYLT